MRSTNKSTGFLIFVLLLGGIAGSLIGDLLGSHIGMLQFLRNVYKIGTSNPITLDLKVVSLSFGLNFNINLMAIIGLIVAIILYRKS